MRKLLLFPVILLALFLTGCTDEPEEDPTVDSDSSQSYADGSRVPTDTEVYTITGEVVGQVNSLERQVEPAHGEISGSTFNGYGSISGSTFGPVEKGKGYVRILVNEADPTVDLAPVGDVSILKVTDTKGTALVAGDIVTFKCRRQYEAIAAVKDNQKFDKTAVETWELDYCRLASPVIQVKPEDPSTEKPE